MAISLACRTWPPTSYTEPVTWLAEQQPDPAWAPPVRRWRPHPALLVTAALALVAALIWGLGGFADRTDLRLDARPGQVISTGPYEFAFTEATAQRMNRFGSEYIVQVLVKGTGRTTGHEAITPETLNPMFAAALAPGGEVRENVGQRFGPGATYGHGTSFTPGLPPVEFSVVFELGGDASPATTLTFAVAELEYSDTTLLGTGEQNWNNADARYVMSLPLTRLPDQD